jgi:hypothetical protein
VAVTPADFELYSRATGTPMPRTPQEQMQMAPMVYKYMQNRGYQQEGFFDSALGRGLRNAAIIGGAYALGNAFKGSKTDPPTPPSGGSGAVSVPVSPVTPLPPTLDPNSGGFDPSGGMSPSGVRPSGGNPPVSPQTIEASWEDQGREMPVVQELVTPTGNIEIHRYDPNGVLTTQPKTPVSRENVGTTGSLTRDLNSQIDRSNVWDGGASPTVVVGDRGGFGPAPAPRSEVEGIRDMEFSMKPPINRDPSFFNPTGSWGVGDTANLLGSTINFGVENAPRMAAQGYYDIAKGARDLQKGYDDVKAVAGGIYDAGAATRGWHDRNLVPAGKRIAGIFMAPGLPTSASQQTDGIETGNASILFDHPDVSQLGTGSDEVQSNRNHILHGAVDRNGNPLQMSRRVNAPSGLDSEGVPIGYIPQVKARDVGPDASVSDPVEYQWYGGQKPRQGSLNEATRALRNKYADVYESQGLADDILPDAERVGEANVSGSSGGNIVTKLFDKAKALYDENTQIANEIAREQEVEAAAQNVLNDMYSSGGGYEAYQEFEPKKSKTGGGSGVKSLAYDNQGQVVVDYWDRNPEKQTPGGYVSDSYQGAITGDKRDELVTNTANPDLISGNMTQEQMDDHQSLVADEMDADETYQAGLRGGRFGRGEGQVSAGKFANAIKKDQKTALEFLKENSDTLRGI